MLSILMYGKGDILYLPIPGLPYFHINVRKKVISYIPLSQDYHTFHINVRYAFHFFGFTSKYGILKIRFCSEIAAHE